MVSAALSIRITMPLSNWGLKEVLSEISLAGAMEDLWAFRGWWEIG